MNTTKTYTPAKAIRHAALHVAQVEGSVQKAVGVWLCSQEHVIDDQEVWGDEDGAKAIDFTIAPFWITTDCGNDPTPIYGADDDDLIEALAND